ncbi:PTS lactose/cellobiose transporter subunit IIA [Vagococcus vulneris]|uniref:PTS lactose/cellobiose transporter subunit IIA n=1 Tax=Vagococcus vulneris TaxID=1977869 RepID=A0A429ZYH1_9ENTE|nr:PTS lactose/cellobiose transporter subunit IIA [Vagococcus vulneris]RST98998.1 PTS lactose/cellobiose transporter subunit IIA [Vagococcus vulneris]
MSQEQLEAVMGLIINASNAKSDAMEAIQASKKGNFDEADIKIKTAESSIVEAHQGQTKLLTQEVNGEELIITLLTVHSQDHLMTSMMFMEVAKELVDVYKRMDVE